jgi:UDP-glucose 4-epimerase
MTTKTVLITGGAGYIGKICHYHLQNLGYKVLIVDDLSSGNSPLSIENFAKFSLLDKISLYEYFQNNNIDAVIHLASRIQVGESIKAPLDYYQINVMGTINLLKMMIEFNTTKLIFASSAAVYGQTSNTPISETNTLQPLNPYGFSKLFSEQIITDAINLGIEPIILRLFNVSGAVPEKLLGECHKPETHLIPLTIQRCINGKPIKIFGNDYQTKDGTCIRDYIHVLDVVKAINLALGALLNNNGTGIYNLGSSIGSSVLEVVQNTASILNMKPKIQCENKRIGDPPILLADSSKFINNFNWLPVNSTLNNILSSSIEYQNIQ